jgi:hypothetical protein
LKHHSLPNDLRSRVQRARERKNKNPTTRQELSVTLEELEPLLAAEEYLRAVLAGHPAGDAPK